MLRKLLTFSVGLAATITLSCIPITALRSAAPHQSGGIGQAVNKGVSKVPEQQQPHGQQDAPKPNIPSENSEIQAAPDQTRSQDPNPPGARTQDWKIECHQRRQMTRYEKGSLVIGSLTLLVGCFVLRIYSGQLEQMRLSTQAATKAADAALGTVELARTDQRAWIGVPRFQLVEEPRTGQQFGFKIWLANTGKTPAIDMGDKTTLVIIGKEPEMSFDELEQMGVVQRGPGNITISPTGPTSLLSIDHLGPVIPPDLLAEYRAGTKQIYLLSRIDYKDIFGEKHWIEVCASHSYSQPLDQFILSPTRNKIDAQKRREGQ